MNTNLLSNFKKFLLHCLGLFSVLSAFVSCTQAEPSKTEFALGTICTVTLFDEATDIIYDDIFNKIREIENLMSVNISASDISRINAAAGITPVHIDKDVFEVIEQAVYFAKISDGAFDPTIGNLVSLWGISSDSPRVPSREEIAEVLPLINWQDIELNENEQTVFLKRSSMALDLGAIAKGYAADAAAAIISKAGVKRAIIDLGGNIVLTGEKKDKSAWRVGIQNPVEQRGQYIGVLRILGEANKARTIVTSGVNERFIEKDGVHYHHIFSPDSGYPAENGLLSVTIITTNSMNADALSTAVFVLGYEKGRALIESIAETEAVFIFEDYSVKKTDGADLTITDNAFSLVNIK